MTTFKIKNKEFVSKFKFDSEKFSLNDIFVTKNLNEINSALETIIKNNKTPVIIRSKNNILPKNDILKIFENQKFQEMDFRHYFLRMREKTNNRPVIDEMSRIILDCFIKGMTLLLNFDDCCIKYEELFDPDIKEFYAPHLFSALMFTPRDFANPKNWHDHFKDNNVTYDKNFRFIIYSKFVLDSSYKEEEIIRSLEKRFEKALPLRKLCFVILSK